MEWRDRGIVLGVRRHGETSAVCELMTRERGRHLGLVRGGRSRRQQPVLQPGNEIEATWRARLDEHLGSMTVEPVELRAALLMNNMPALHGVQLVAAHLRLLAEREPHPRLYDALIEILQRLDERDLLAAMILRFEVALLEEAGFGLELDQCALTGASTDLAFVSPRTGRAVTREAGAPWADKLIALPALFWDPDADPREAAALSEGFALTRHFLARHLWEPRNIPEPPARHAFLVATLGADTDSSQTA